MPIKTATDPAELSQLLDEWEHFRKVRAFTESYLKYHSLKLDIDQCKRDISHSTGWVERAESPMARQYWVRQTTVEQKRLVGFEDASDTHELVWRRAWAEYHRLKELLGKLHPGLLPLPGLDPLPETTEQQTAFADWIGWIRGQVLAEMAKVKVKKPKNKVGRPANPQAVKAFVCGLYKVKTPWKDVVDKVNEKYPKAEPWTEDACRKMVPAAKTKNNFRHTITKKT